MCLLLRPEGVATMQKAHPDVDIYTAAVDRQLDAHGYILPGLGDAATASSAPSRLGARTHKKAAHRAAFLLGSGGQRDQSTSPA